MWNRIMKWLRELLKPVTAKHFKRSRSIKLSGKAQFNRDLLEKYTIITPESGWSLGFWSVDGDGNLEECLLDLGKATITMKA